MEDKKTARKPFVSQNPFRYNITMKLAAFDKTIQAKIKKRVRTSMRVSEATISRWIHVKVNDGNDIPALALFQFSIALNTNMEDLFNDQKQKS